MSDYDFDTVMAHSNLYYKNLLSEYPDQEYIQALRKYFTDPQIVIILEINREHKRS